MTFPLSTAATAKLNLVANIKAQPACADPVLVVYDEPPTEVRVADIVMVGDVHGSISPLSIAGGIQNTNSLQEEYYIDIVIRSFRGGDNARAAFESAETLWGAVQTAVRNDMFMGTAGLLWSYPRNFRILSEWNPTHQGRVVQLMADIFCRRTL